MSDTKPIGYAVRMATGPFVGIWQDQGIAEHVRSKQHTGQNDEVIPVVPAADLDAALYEKEKAEAGWIKVTYIAALLAERDALQRFKSFVHSYLDSRGVPVDPPGKHADEGCRVGQRLEVLCDERDTLAADTKRLDFMIEHAAAHVHVEPAKPPYEKMYQVWEQDEDEEWHIISGDGRFFKSPREAIDAARSS